MVGVGRVEDDCASCCGCDGVGDSGPFRGDGEPGEWIVCRVRVLKINAGMQLDICEAKEGGYTGQSASQPWNNLGREAKAATTPRETEDGGG